MNNRYFVPAILGLGALGAAWGASRLYPSATSPSATRRPNILMPEQMQADPPSLNAPPGMMPPGMMPPPFQPSTRLSNEAISPDGKLIAVKVIHSLTQFKARTEVVVVDAASGRVLLRDGSIGSTGTLAWNEAGQPQRLNIEGAPHQLTKEGQSWTLTPVGRAPSSQRPRFAQMRNANVENETVLPLSDLAVWFLLDTSTGQGNLVASKLHDESEVWLPPSLSVNRINGNTNFAAPPRRGQTDFQLAALYDDPPGKTFSSVLEVWNLSRHALLFHRTFPTWVRRFAWTRDGRTIVLHDTPRVEQVPKGPAVKHRNGKTIVNLNALRVENGDASPQYFGGGIDVLDANTGKPRATVTLEGLSEAFDVSDDSRYFLTVTNNYNTQTRKWLSRLNIHRVADGQVVCHFERPKTIEAKPHFAANNSSLLLWSAQDTVFLQRWHASKTARKLRPRQIRIPLS